jgi:hypothetical protein
MTAVSALAVGTDAIPAKGTTSPVAYAVEKMGSNSVTWSDFAGAIYALNKTASLTWRYPTGKSQLHRINMSLVTPLDRPVTDAGSNTTHVVVGPLRYNGEFIIPTSATAAETSEFIRRVIQTTLDAQFKGAIADRAFPF